MVDQFSKVTTDLVQLARLALTGRTQDVRGFVTILGRRYRKIAPDAAGKLTALVAENLTPRAPVRNAEVAIVPVDMDTRLSLLRFDPAPTLGHSPVWSPDVGIQLGIIVNEHRRANDLTRVGLWPTRTAVLTGPPGVGKTLAARWLAAELGLPLLVLDLSAVMSSFLGRTGANLRHVLDYAKGLSCVLLLDEIDAIAKRRDDVHEVGELKRLVNVLLQEIDDWPAGGLLVAATNHANLLYPAVWRRFESRIEFPLPDAQATRKLIEILIEDSPVSDGWLAALGIAFAGLSFSEIEREILAARKASVMKSTVLETELFDVAKSRRKTLQKSDLKRLACDLVKIGFSTRDVSEITGLSRDTIRKAQSPSKTGEPNCE